MKYGNKILIQKIYDNVTNLPMNSISLISLIVLGSIQLYMPNLQQ